MLREEEFFAFTTYVVKTHAPARARVRFGTLCAVHWFLVTYKRLYFLLLLLLLFRLRLRFSTFALRLGKSDLSPWWLFFDVIISLAVEDRLALFWRGRPLNVTCNPAAVRTRLHLKYYKRRSSSESPGHFATHCVARKISHHLYDSSSRCY